MAVDLYPHQTDALKKLGSGKILKGGVGTGKSITAMAYFVIHECHASVRVNGVGQDGVFKTPKDLYIFTTARKRNELDWEEEAARFGISKLRSASKGGVKLTVDSWNNIVNYTDIKDAFVIFDEQRLVGAGAWVKAFYKIAKHNNWIVLSATPGDSWIEYAPIFIANGWYKNRSDFIDQHVIYRNFVKFPMIDRYVDTGKLHKYRQQVIIDMPYLRHTKRHLEIKTVDHDQALYHRAFKERWHVYEDRPIKDIGELFRVLRQIVNSDPSRLAAVMEIHEEYPRLIIFYNFDYELAALRTLGNTLDVRTAEWNGHKHEPVPTTDKWLYLVQCTAGAEAWNCITTNATIMYSLNYSYKIYEQVQGRTDRLNTPYKDLYYFIFRSNTTIDRSIHKAVRDKKNFNEKALVPTL